MRLDRQYERRGGEKGRQRAIGVVAFGAGVVAAVAYGVTADSATQGVNAAESVVASLGDSEERLRELERISRRTESRLLSLHAAQSELRELRSRVAELREQCSPSHAPEADNLDEGPSERVEYASLEPAADQEEALLMALDSLHETEAIDRAWSREMTQSLHALFLDGPAADGNYLQEISCRTSHCVLQIEHETKQGPRSLSQAMLNPAFAGGLIARRSDDASSTRVFAFRPGYEEALAAASSSD